VSAWYAFAAVVVLLAVLFASARLLLPQADQYNAEIGERLSRYLKQPVAVRSLDAEWHGWGPSLVLRDAALLDTTGEHPVFQLKKVRLGLDLLASVRHWQPMFSHITLVGANLVLTRSQQGRFSVAGLPGQEDSEEQHPDDTAALMTWLLSQGRLALEDSTIIWRDEMVAGRSMRFSAVNVSLRNDGERHQLDASLDLSRRLGKSLVLRVDMRGNPLQAAGRRTQVYFAGEHVHLAELFEAQRLAGVDISANNASFQVWAQWQAGQLQKITGSAEAGGVTLASAAVTKKTSTDARKESSVAETLSLDRFSADFDWRWLNNGWQFEANDLLLVSQSRQWQPARVSLRFDRSTQADKFDAYASFLQLEDISQILSLFSVGGEALQEPLLAISPRGELRDAGLSWQAADVPQYTAYARLQNASMNAWRAVPAAQKVDGQLWLDSGRGQVALQRAAVVLDFPDMFRWPLKVDQLSGNVGWQQSGEQWHVTGRKLEASNDDVSASASLDVVLDDANKSPFMSLLVNFHDGDGSQVPRYLPTGIMAVEVVNWLDEAIVGAHLVSGGALFHGRLADFPFDRGNGRFEVSFAAENASLNYAENWPPITNINADVRFLGRGMSVAMQQGRIFSNQIQWAEIDIVDMTAMPLELNITGEVQGATQEKLDYLVASPPLYRAFARHLEGFTADGDSLLNLNLFLPIGNDDPVKVSGWLNMKDNSLSIPPLGQVLSAVDGRLEFFQDGLRAENIQADLFGQNTQINISTDEDRKNPKVKIRAQGMFDAPDLAARYLPRVQELLTGDGDWRIAFDIPLGGHEAAAILQARSTLKGVEVRLPPPFDKKAQDAGNLELRVDFEAGKLPVLRANYEGFVDAIFALGEFAPDVALLDDERAENSFRGEVSLNAGPAKMPALPGLRLVGRMDSVSLDDWRNLRLSEGVDAENDAPAPMLNSADFELRELEAYGQRLRNVRLKLATVASGLRADIDSEELKGRILLPHKAQENPIRAELDYAYISGVDSSGGVMEPRSIPALDLRIADFRYKKSRLGSVRLETASVADGMRIEQLVIKPRSTTITARGGWFVSGTEQSSNVQVHVESKNIGHTLRALDYVGGIDKGKGSADLELRWPGSFVEVDASQMQGKLNISLKDGYLLDVDPGAGRMFGMLSIQTLPRRLLLDFSDVFKKGFGFDRIKGNFTIEDGDAYTSNLYMDGPAARVDIAGRTGLAEQDYDQLVTVTPHVSETLPVIGILAATPQVGAIVLAFQKIFKPAIDDATRNQYTITGSWNAPVIKKIKKSQPETENFLDDES
jgi:uncharacterized protein (TIGR02099 family)